MFGDRGVMATSMEWEYLQVTGTEVDQLRSQIASTAHTGEVYECKVIEYAEEDDVLLSEGNDGDAVWDFEEVSRLGSLSHPEYGELKLFQPL